MKEIKKSHHLNLVGSMTDEKTLEALDLWLNMLLQDPELSIHDKVVADLDYEELIGLLQNCKRHMKHLVS